MVPWRPKPIRYAYNAFKPVVRILIFYLNIHIMHLNWLRCIFIKDISPMTGKYIYRVYHVHLQHLNAAKRTLYAPQP